MPLRGVVARWCEGRLHFVVRRPSTPRRALAQQVYPPLPTQTILFQGSGFLLGQGWKLHPWRQAFRLRVHSAINAEASRMQNARNKTVRASRKRRALAGLMYLCWRRWDLAYGYHSGQNSCTTLLYFFRINFTNYIS